MVENRKRDSVQVHEAGKAELKRAKAIQRNDQDKPLRYLDIGTKANVDEKTVKRFFNGTSVKRSSAFAVAQALGLQLEDLIDSPEIPEPERETALDWREICNREFQKQLDINQRRRQATEKATELGIHVPLGLVERKQQSRSQSRDFSPEMGMEAYQPTLEVVEKTYQHQQFLDEIIGETGKANQKGVAIIGEPGAGKTTLLEQIGKYLQQQQALPIFIPLTNLGEKSLKEYLLTQWGEQNITPSQLEELLQTQRVWLLLDGVDEMAQASPLDAVYRQAVELQQARVVLSCRLNVWDASTKNLPDFQTFKTLEFSEEQVQQFIRQWFGEEQLWERLKESGKERLRDLVKNPLRLSLLCQTWESGQELPETQAALYERFVRYFYEWKPQEFPVTLTQREELNAALARLALEAIDKGKTRFRISQRFALRVMEEEWLNLACRLGWLNQVDRDKDTEEAFYAFYHPTFQEYFAALAVEDWSFFLTHVPENPQQGIYRIFEPQWKQVILLWLGRGDIDEEAKGAFIQALVEFEDGCKGFYHYQAYFFAAIGTAEFKDCTKVETIICQVIRWSFGYLDIKSQSWSIFPASIAKRAKTALWQTSHDKFIEQSLQLLKACLSEDVSINIIGFLGKIAVGNETAIAALIQLLSTTQSNVTRWNAASSLGKIAVGNETAIAALIQLLSTTQSDVTRWNAASSLGKIAVGNKTAIAALIQLLSTTQSDVTRWNAASSLGKIAVGNETAIAALIQLLAPTRSEDIRSMAAHSLGKIAIENETAIAALVQILSTTKSASIQYNIASNLGKIAVGNETAIAALVQLLSTTQSVVIRWIAASSLGKIDVENESAIAALVQLLYTTSWDIWLNIETTFWENEIVNTFREDEIFDFVSFRLLNTTKPYGIRRNIVKTFGEIAVENETAIAALVHILYATQFEKDHIIAAKCLGQIAVRNETAIAALVHVLYTTKSENIRWSAANALERIDVGNKNAIAALFQILYSTRYEDIQLSVASILGKIYARNETAIDALVQILSTTKSESIQLSAARILGELAVVNETAIAALVQLLSITKSESIRWSAAKSLEKIAVENEGAIAALVQILSTTKSEGIRWSAASILGKIDVGNEGAIAALVQILSTTKSEGIRWNAAESLETTLITKEHYVEVVSALKDCITDEVYENNFDRFDSCYEIVWKCAQNLSYPDFYQAWHYPTLTPHPEMQETTGVGVTPEALLLNWDNFPQNLAQALKKQPEIADKISVTCIDASQFLDSDNPASEIYVKLVKAGYPRSADGTPKDLQSLKVYCELECPEACLIFYEAPSNPPPQGFSPIFLNALSRFSPANRIAIVSEKPDSSLQTFSPTHPNLIPTLIAWMRATVLED
ncbi:HEAT repeat domain-containing protein [Desertifilum sp. FACHB-1129]|uniref:HEAT repeat domain-containing protein n=1 Tax=Desertifilum sp. FACHB-1129 TaxID=2692795 RepID=UPI0016885C77|nr:HEAT repeat domain-containing protein [Desertifilum sp. FACHB-1129]MBD2310372.1 HEAT repeat domain-containing protein [Desertifilum sp. FACHB-1129]